MDSVENNVPVDMLLFCPNCAAQHIDAPDERTQGWANPPHRSHLCHACGHIWRPSDVPTNGVATIKTKGEKDGRPQPRHFATARAFYETIVTEVKAILDEEEKRG